MAKISDQAFGVGAPELWFYVGGTLTDGEYSGGRWNHIDLPGWTHCADEPEGTTFIDNDPIEETMADGTLYFLDRGCRGEFPIEIIPADRDLYKALCALRGWQAQNPDRWFILRRYSDKNESYKVKWRGPLHSAWGRGQAGSGYEISFTLVGVDLLDTAEPDDELVSHYCSTSIVYDGTDTGVHSYCGTGCPWEFGGVISGDLPAEWITTGTSAVARLRIDNRPQVGLRCQGAERVRLDYVTPNNGYIEASLLIHAGVGGLIWRANAGMTTYYAIRIDTAADTIDIYKTAGLLLTLPSPIALALDTWFNVKVQFNGSLHKVWIQSALTAGWLYVGGTTDATYTTGYCGQFTIAGGDLLGKGHDVYDNNLDRAEIDDTTLALAAHYTAQSKYRYPWTA